MFFLEKFARKLGRPITQVAEETMVRLCAYSWPGNIRELENEIERLVVLAGDEKAIGEELLSPRIRQAIAREVGDNDGSQEASSLPAAVDALEKNLIYEVLRRNQWNKTKAAAELRISRRNLIRKVNKYKLDGRRRGA
jgi:transcriptional regulator with PAS, ATPase and Fis domain